ncbi:MAG: IS21 family transposase [Actinomycetota bacterium]
MAQERLSMRKIREIVRLRFGAGLSHRQIARSVGVGQTTVSDYLSRFRAAGLSWPLGPDLDDEGALEALLFGGPRQRVPTRVVPDWARVHDELRDHKHVTLALVWEEYRREHPDGYGYSQFCDLYRRWTRTLDVTMRQHHRPGEKMFVDFSGGTIPVVDEVTGEVRHAKLFVAVLGFSNYMYADAVFSEDLPTWIGQNTKAVEFFGGTPRIAVPDNLKAGVTRPCRYEPELNPAYAEWGRHYEVAVIPARVRRPRDKAKAEVGVQIAERWILAALRHRAMRSLSELREAVRGLLERINARKMKKVGMSRREIFEAKERAVLRPLPAARFEMAEWKKARVNIDYHVEFDRHYYSVPFRFARQEVEVRATAGTVEILASGKRIASHPRSGEKFRHTTVAEHMPKSHRAAGEWTPSRILAWAGKVGPETASFVKELLERRPHPEQGFRAALGVLRLSKSYEASRLERACERAASYRSYSYRSVESILKAGLDGRPPRRREDGSEQIPLHENLRGPDYYH